MTAGTVVGFDANGNPVNTIVTGHNTKAGYASGIEGRLCRIAEAIGAKRTCLKRHSESTRSVRSSGTSALDEEALALLRRAQPFPPPPELPGQRVDLTGQNGHRTTQFAAICVAVGRRPAWTISGRAHSVSVGVAASPS
jgi:TonB family protein